MFCKSLYKIIQIIYKYLKCVKICNDVETTAIEGVKCSVNFAKF